MAIKAAFAKILNSRRQESVNGYRLDPDAGFGEAFRGVMDNANYAPPPLLTEAQIQAKLNDGTLTEYLNEAIQYTWGKVGSGMTDFQFDSPYTTDQGPIAIPHVNPLYEWDYATRRYILECCHAAYQTNPDARALNHIANFAVGQGFTWTAYNPDVREFLTEFIDHPENRLREYERQAARDLLIDGEIVIEWRETAMGMPILIPKRPYDLHAIKTEMGHYRKIESFHFREVQDDGQGYMRQIKYRDYELSADKVTFAAINNHAYELRGRSELYPILPWLQVRRGWLENRARLNHWKSMILWLVSVETTNQQTIRATAARWARPPKPGSVAVESSKISVEAVQAKIDAMNAADDGRQLLLQIAKGFQLAEYFMADGQNANLASATRQQLPSLVRFEQHQFTLVHEVWRPIFERALQMQTDAGLLPADVEVYDTLGEPTGEKVPIAESFEISYAPVIEEDLKALTEALAIQLDKGVVSKRIAIQMLGYDPDKVEADLLEEKLEAEEDMPDVPDGGDSEVPDTDTDDDTEDSEDDDDRNDA